MSIKTMVLAAAAVVTLAAPAAAFAQDYHGYDRGDYSHGYRHDDSHRYRDYGRDRHARYRNHDRSRGYGDHHYDEHRD
ncbi:MAG TPA: hypothetical protein VHZ26_14370 [Caulobacteraceae bacterium]|nr:hypothetical protein [Caulobacteraceae bacterium]